MEDATLGISIDDVRAAAERLAALAHRTPVLTSRTFDEAAGARLFFKCENLQRAGSFKFRGASNAVFSLAPDEAARGVLAHSSGNHGAALAMAARLRGVPAHIVIPEGATAAKVESARRLGARVVRCGPSLRAREETAARVRAETGARLIHPYNDPRVAAGQGTAALELLAEVPDLDFVVVPVSGGGLASGTAIAATEARPGTRVVGVEPAGADDALQSLRAGAIVALQTPETICDGLRGALCPLTFGILRSRLETIMAVPDAASVQAMRRIWEVMKLVVEPSSAIALAALLDERGRAYFSGSRVGVILSGGNVDLDNLPWR